MKTIIWVDRNVNEMSEYVTKNHINKFVKTKFFNKFKEALEYLDKNYKSVDLVISNYSTLTWKDLFLNETDNDFKTCFEFYDSIKLKNFNLPFILHSGVGDFDSRLQDYQKNEDFKFFPKYTDNNLEYYLKNYIAC